MAAALVGCAGLDNVDGGAVAHDLACTQARATLAGGQVSANAAKGIAATIAEQAGGQPQVQALARKVANSTTDAEVRANLEGLIAEYCT